MDEKRIWSETEFNEYDLLNENKFADAIVLTFIPQKFNLDPLLLVHC